MSSSKNPISVHSDDDNDSTPRPSAPEFREENGELILKIKYSVVGNWTIAPNEQTEPHLALSTGANTGSFPPSGLIVHEDKEKNGTEGWKQFLKNYPKVVKGAEYVTVEYHLKEDDSKRCWYPSAP